MSGTPPISLTNANNSFSEITWTYTDFTTPDELDLIVINSTNGKIQKIPLNNSLTYLNLDKQIDLTNVNTVFIEAVVSSVSISSNSLSIPKRLTTPTILNSGNDPVVAYNERVEFAVNSIDSNATKLNIVLYDATWQQLNEFINIDLPTTSLAPTNKITTTYLGPSSATNTDPVTITIEKDGTKYIITMDKLFSNSTYQIAVYTSVTVSGVENESEVSNTIQYVEPNSAPQIPTLKSLEFDVSTPNNYMVEFITPANSGSYTTTSITLRVSSLNTFTNYADVPIDFTSISATGILPANTTYKLNVNLSTVITAGIMNYYKLIVSNSDDNSETGNTTSKTNILNIMACNTPVINHDTLFNVIFKNNSFDVVTNQSTSVDYAGTGTKSYSIKINNTDTYDNVPTIKTITATPGETYSVSHYGIVSGIVNKVTMATMPTLVSGVGANAIFTSGTQSSSTVNYTDLSIGTMSTFTFFNKLLAPVISINATNLDNNLLVPLQNHIKLNWTPGVNLGASDITYTLIYSTDSTFNNATTVSSLSNAPYSLTTSSNDTKHYFKIITKYYQATTTYRYIKSSNSTLPYVQEDLESSPLILLDSNNNIIGVSSFTSILAPASLSLDATRHQITATWSYVDNPLANSAKPSTTGDALATTITYTVQATSTGYNKTETVSSITNIFDGLVDGNSHTITVKTNLNNIYRFYQSGINFSATSPITISSGAISGTATPLDGPDITSLDYNTITNVLNIGLLLNGTPKSGITITAFGIGTTPPTSYARSLSLSHPDFTVSNNTYSLSLTSSIGTATLTQYAVIASADTGISIATKGFDDNITTQADTLKKITSQY